MCDYRSARQPQTVEPGQIWLVEQDPAWPLSAVDRDALTSANVMIYDRALAPLVAQVLPIGGYAEPLPATGHAAGPAISPRALRVGRRRAGASRNWSRRARADACAWASCRRRCSGPAAPAICRFE